MCLSSADLVVVCLCCCMCQLMSCFAERAHCSAALIRLYIVSVCISLTLHFGVVCSVTKLKYCVSVFVVNSIVKQSHTHTIAAKRMFHKACSMSVANS